GSANVQLLSAEILASFYPTSYGPVASSVAEISAEFPDAKLVQITDQMTGIETTLYQVDLRTLELAAKETRIKALEAQNALLDAKRKIRLQSQTQTIPSAGGQK
ncbi:hypothetical protein JYT16_01330, partial [Gemmatimonas aurantiaca]|nr:hypothetical protein [Gemmatimonas aurantiaca]